MAAIAAVAFDPRGIADVRRFDIARLRITAIIFTQQLQAEMAVLRGLMVHLS